jgi:hypothetical protein
MAKTMRAGVIYVQLPVLIYRETSAITQLMSVPTLTIPERATCHLRRIGRSRVAHLAMPELLSSNTVTNPSLQKQADIKSRDGLCEAMLIPMSQSHEVISLVQDCTTVKLLERMPLRPGQVNDMFCELTHTTSARWKVKCLHYVSYVRF